MPVPGQSRRSLADFRTQGVFLLAIALSSLPLSAGAAEDSLQQIRERGELRVVTRNAPTTWYQTRDNLYAGLEHDMASAFAGELGVEVRFVIKNSVAAILKAVDNGEGDFAAAGLTRTPERAQQYLFGPDYQWVRQQVVCNRQTKNTPSSARALRAPQLWVAEETSYVERLEALQRQYPDIDWILHKEADTEFLLAQVSKVNGICTVADSNILAINQRYLPELKTAFALSKKEPLAWLMSRDKPGLQQAMQKWFRTFKRQGNMADLLERYYGHIEDFDYAGTLYFERYLQQRLPQYKTWFIAAAAASGLDWKLLAAVSYQESHWNPRAKSPTGVRGIMMLTLPTARQLGVKSRLDARSSIFAGAKYLAALRDRLPQSIAEPDRTWMSLAAYNMGFGHLLDARKLARRLGHDPDSWRTLEKSILLLSRHRHYQTLKHGYARGGEAVLYVDRVRHFRDLIEHHLGDEARRRVPPRLVGGSEAGPALALMPQPAAGLFPRSCALVGISC